MISVVIPLYNKQSCIGSTIESVLNQSYQNFEVIVVDDGSTDGSADVVRQIQDPRIRLIQKSNGGVSSARNAGIRQSKSELIAFMDADDLWSSEYLQEIDRLNSAFPDAAIMGTSYYLLKGGNQAVTNNKLPKGYVGIVDNVRWEYGHLYWTSAVCCKKSALEEVGMFDERIAYGEDTDVWWRIMLKYPAAYSNKPLAVYRFDEENRAMNKRIPLEKLYVYYFEKYAEDRKANEAFRHFIDKECMWWLYPYLLDGNNRAEVARIVSQIDFSEYKFSFWFRFHFPELYNKIRKFGR